MEFNNAYELSKTDEVRAGVLVRLHRRVEAQLARSSQPVVGVSIVTEAGEEDQMLLDLNDAVEAAVVGHGREGMGGDDGGDGERMADVELDTVVAGVMDEILAADGSGDRSFMEM